jgi:hypothetical protein
MSTKSVNVKNFVKDTGVKNQLFVFAGYNPNPLLSEANESAINLWNYSDFSVRVGQNSVLPVVPYVKWTQKKPYKPWSSTSPNSGNFYAYNDQNGYVYLCISDNASNRTDHAGDNVSNIRPTHTAGIQQYSDGYSWKPLYKITPSIERFVTATWLPVISFEIYDSSSQKTLNQLTSAFCTNASTTTEIGQCAIYAKVPLNTDDDEGTTEYEKGDLFLIANDVSCSQCHYLMLNDDKYESVFYGSDETVPSTKQILDQYDLVGSLITSGEITTSSPYYYLHQINENDNIAEGAIISAFIDLSGFSTSQLITSTANPEFTVTSNSGFDGRIRLKTSVYQDAYIITGIEVLNAGSSYKDIALSIDSNILSVDSDMITSVIDINIDTIDGLGFDPVDVLNAQHAMIDARIEKKTIQDSSILIPDKLNYFGLIQNPTSTIGTKQITSGSNFNKKLDVIYRTTILAEVTNDIVQSQLPAPNEVYNTQGLDTEDAIQTSTNDILIGGVTEIEGGVASCPCTNTMELKNVAYDKSDYLIGLEFQGVKSNNVITNIVSVPEFVQYSGKVLSTKKLNTDLPISDVDSVIIRINMIKGM